MGSVDGRDVVTVGCAVGTEDGMTLGFIVDNDGGRVGSIDG